MVWRLRRCITRPGVAGSNPLKGTMVDSAIHTLEVDQMPGIFRGGCAVLRQVNPTHKRGPESFS